MLIETANTAYEERDRAQEKLATLIQQAEREKIEFDKEMQQVNSSIEKYKDLREFMINKEKEKADLEKMNIDHKNINDDDLQIEKLNPAKDKQNITSSTSLEKVESYEETFAKIEAATGIHDIDELVNTFIKAEENNFTLFKFVNDLSNDIENTEQQINEMKIELSQYMGKGQSNDNQRRLLLDDLEEKLLKTEKKAGQLEIEFQKALKKIELIKAGIESIFTTLE